MRPEFSEMAEEEVVDKVTAFCRENMAAYKVPKVIKMIDAIPLTAVGKIDKKVLRSQALQEQE